MTSPPWRVRMKNVVVAMLFTPFGERALVFPHESFCFFRSFSPWYNQSSCLVSSVFRSSTVMPLSYMTRSAYLFCYSLPMARSILLDPSSLLPRSTNLILSQYLPRFFLNGSFVFLPRSRFMFLFPWLPHSTYMMLSILSGSLSCFGSV